MLRISHTVKPPSHNEDLTTHKNESEEAARKRLKTISDLARLCIIKEPEKLNYPEHKWYK